MCRNLLQITGGAFPWLLLSSGIDRQQSNEPVNQSLKRIYETLNKLSAGTPKSKS